MRVFQINSFGNLSTGSIACGIYRTLKIEGYDGIIAYGRGRISEDIPNIKIGSTVSVITDGVISRLTDRAGFFSKAGTIKLIKQIEAYKPDIVHLHNLHGYYVNMEVLFEYLKILGVPVVWTLHDCWAYTGHCCYYSMNNCNKWKTHCYDCKYKYSYPISFVDNSERNFDRKKELILSMPNLTLVAVSEWLASEVERSFLKNVPIVVIQNGIDTDVFKPTESNFRAEHGLENKKIILGVASTWDVRKGLNDFIELSKLLDEETRIVLVGLNDKQKKNLPYNIIGLPRTKTAKELAGLYSTADVFFNASVEETFGLPTVEAMACGTPVIVYDATALPEVVDGESGRVVEPHDIDKVVQWVTDERFRLLHTSKICDKGKKFSQISTYSRYIRLYERLIMSD